VSIRYDNDTEVYLLDRQGPGHQLTHDGGYTRCALPAKGAVKSTFAAVHVFVGHAICIECFGAEGVRWP
jgi:hypothetical protein